MKKLLVAVVLVLTTTTAFAGWKPMNREAVRRDMMAQCKNDLPYSKAKCVQWTECSISLLEEGFPSLMEFLQLVAKNPAIGSGSAYFVGRVCGYRVSK